MRWVWVRHLNVRDGEYSILTMDVLFIGKTLQCIALMWTLMKQSPSAGKGTIEKCIIVCPSSLVRNWGNELSEFDVLIINGLDTNNDELIRPFTIMPAISQLNGWVLGLLTLFLLMEKVEKRS